MADRLRGLAESLLPTKSLIREADRARDRGDHTRAAALYARALRKAPHKAPIHIQAAHMFKEGGDIVPAEQHYLHAIALRPDDPDAYLHLAHLYMNSARPEQAYAHFLRLSELDPAWPRDDLWHTRRILNLGAGAGLQRACPSGPVTRESAAASGLIDVEWYRQRYPDIGFSDPLDHFMGYGRFELRRPGPGFDPHWYLRAYPQVIGSGLDPFSHYLLIGRADGLRPIDPYQRWIEDYDTLDAEDRGAIDAHILDAKLDEPTVLVEVNAETADSVEQTIQSLRGQLLRPRITYLCLATDCPSKTRRAVRALVGSDDRFRIVDTGHPLEAIASHQPIVLIDAGIELREHALYMLVQAIKAETAVVYADHDCLDSERARRSPTFKPAASPELLRQVNYIGACALLRSGAEVEEIAHSLVSSDRSAAEVIRSAARSTSRRAVVHVPFVLYHDHVERAAPPSAPGPRLADAELPTVTIIIPTRDRMDLLRPCIDSLRRETDYPLDRIDIVVVDNGSEEEATITWLATEQARGHLRTLHAPIPFNYPVLNNMAAASSTADVLVLLNNDTEVQDPDWLRGLVGQVMQPDVGAVGPMLLYADGTIQHAGVVLGVGTVAAHAHGGLAHDAPGAFGFAQRTREVAAVTGACLAIRRAVYEEIGGLDPLLPVAFNDVLLCLAAIEHGYRNLYVHDVWIRHYESKTRGYDDTIAKKKIFQQESRYALEKYTELCRNDPWYSPNLSFDHPKIYDLAFPPRSARPWRQYKRDRHAPRVILLSSTLDCNTEIGMAVNFQARYLAERGYLLRIGTPTPPRDATPGLHASLDTGADAAAYAVAWDADVIVVHTPNFADVSRWLGSTPPVLLHYHGAEAETASDVAGEAHQIEARLLATPFITQVLADHAETLDELSLARAVIQPPGADRLGIWSSQFIQMREDVRRNRGWTDKIVILVASATGDLASQIRTQLDALISEFDAHNVEFILWTANPCSVISLPGRVTAMTAANTLERQELMVAADMFWSIDEGTARLDASEAAALGLIVFNPPGTFSHDTPKGMALSLINAAVAGGVPDPWSRRAISRVGWAETLSRFEGLLADLHGLTTRPGSSTGTMLSPAALIRDSGLFDRDFYYARNPDVVGHDALQHFLNHGLWEGRSFSRLFDLAWHADHYPEARGNLGGALLDYLRHPRGLRDPNPFFSNKAYLEALGGRDTGGQAPLVHYLNGGAACGLSVGDAFDGSYYTAVYPDVALSGLTPLAHFLTIGQEEGRAPKACSPDPTDMIHDGN